MQQIAQVSFNLIILRR